MILLPVLSYMFLLFLWENRLARESRTKAMHEAFKGAKNQTVSFRMFRPLSYALVEWMILLYGVTELLSVKNAVTKENLVLFWSSTSILCLVEILIKRIRHCQKQKNLSTKSDSLHAARTENAAADEEFNSDKFSALSFLTSLRPSILCIVLILIGASVFLLALMTIPYNWDSMTYHLARIAQWESRGSVAHYATNIVRQISSPPLAEMVGLHVYILSGHSLRLLNLVQTFSYLFCAIGVYTITVQVTLSFKWAQLGTLVYMTIPIVFAEAISTQNDLFSTVWLLIFASELFRLLNDTEKIGMNLFTFGCALVLGCSMGLAYLSKTSVLLAMLVFLAAAFTVMIYKKCQISAVLISTFLAAVVVLLLVVPEMLRTIDTFGELFPSSVSGSILVGSLKPKYLLLNFLKNFCYNLPSRLIPDTTWIFFILSMIVQVLGIAIDDPVISFGGQIYSLPDAQSYNHDTAGNPLIIWTVLFFAVAALIIRIRSKKKMDYVRWLYVLASLLSLFVICTLLRWQPWGTRIMLPYYVLLCPAFGGLARYVTDTLQIQHHSSEDRFTFFCFETDAKNACVAVAKPIILVLIFVLSFTSWISQCLYHLDITMNDSVIGNDVAEYLYTWKSGEYESDRMICEAILEGEYHVMGYDCGEDDYEFPLWVMLDGSNVRIVHINVTNVTNETVKYEQKDELPDCIFWRNASLQEQIEYKGQTYVLEMSAGSDAALYIKEQSD